MPDDAPDLRSHLITLLHNVSLEPAPRCIWFGETYPSDNGDTALSGFSPAVARSILTDVLVQRLYEDFYRRGRPSPQSPFDRMTLRAGASQPFVDELSAANTGSGTRQSGWIVTGVHGREIDPVEVTIRREGLTIRAKLEDIARAEDGMPRIGDEVSLRYPKELPAISPGFYMVLSDEPYDATGRPVVRLYWNLFSWGAAPLVQAITTRMNGAALPFTLKLVNHPDRYQRCDAAVLYLPRSDLDQAVPLLDEVYREVRAYLKRPVPVMTKWIAPGIGLAEDPPDGGSFGVHRCRLLADGLVQGREQGARSIEDRLAVIIETLISAGIDPERPYLNPGSVDDYRFSFSKRDSGSARPLASVAVPHAPCTANLGSREYRDVAASIGAEICAEAFWHQGWCNWLGVEPRAADTPAHHGISYSSLGPDFYGGTSGVALFLAELAVATGEEKTRRTAHAAIRQALGRADTVQPPLQFGLFTGLPGLAYAATRVGALLEATDVTLAAHALLDGINSDAGHEHEHDLLGGAAGGIIALLRLAHLSGKDSLIECAARSGERLVAAATCHEGGCSWPSLMVPGGAHLTGLAHGASGIGIALFELWHATGDERFHDVAARAFAYERGWFDPATGNWPDFRAAGDRSDRPGGQLPYATHWCHGAPGIALARLRAWELTGDSQYRDEAILALLTTERALLQDIHDGTSNYSLCHGLAGNAMILLGGHQLLGSEFEHLRESALQVAADGMRLYAATDRTWPCGTHRGWTPGMMLGTAGIGYFYLTLSDSSLPCVLLP